MHPVDTAREQMRLLTELVPVVPPEFALALPSTYSIKTHPACRQIWTSNTFSRRTC